MNEPAIAMTPDLDEMPAPDLAQAEYDMDWWDVEKACKKWLKNEPECGEAQIRQLLRRLTSGLPEPEIPTDREPF